MRDFLQEYKTRPWPKLEIPPMKGPQIIVLVLFVCAMIAGGWYIWFSGNIRAEKFGLLGLLVPVLFLMKNRYFTIVALLSFQVIVAFLFMGNTEYATYMIIGLVGAVIAFEFPMIVYAALVGAMWVGITSIGIASPLRTEVIVGSSLFVSWIFREKLRADTQPRSIVFPEAKWALIYFAWITMAYTLWCLDRTNLGYLQYKYLIANTVFFIITPFLIDDERKLDWAVLAWMGIGIVAAVATFVAPDLTEPPGEARAWGAASSTFQSHKNWISSLIALSFFTVLGRLYSLKSILLKIFFIGCLLVMFAAMVYQQSRATMATVVACLVTFWVADTIFNKYKRGTLRAMFRFFVLVSAAVVILISVYFIELGAILGSYYDLFNNPMDAGTMQAREDIWLMSYDMIVTENHVFRGLGPAAFWVLGTEYGISEYIGMETEEFTAIHPHCMYLDVFLHLGIPGLVLFLTIAVMILLKLWRGFRIFDNAKYRYLSLGLFCAVLSFYAHGVVEFQYHNILDFWAFLGFCLAAYNVALRQKSTTTSDGDRMMIDPE